MKTSNEFSTASFTRYVENVLPVEGGNSSEKMLIYVVNRIVLWRYFQKKIKKIKKNTHTHKHAQ